MTSCIRTLAFGVLSLFACAWLAAASPAQAGAPGAKLGKQLNTFFSNFSEVYLPSFAEGELSDEDLLAFALSHLNRNAYDQLESNADGTSAKASSKLVDKVTLHYFDRKIEDGRKKAYTVTLADGEGYRFSQVKDVTDLPGGLLRASGIVYGAGSGAVIDPQADPAAWASEGEEVDEAAQFSAVIRKAGKRFVLVSYEETE